MRISEFQMKDIVSLSNGRKLGNIHDLEIDLQTGQIYAIFVVNGSRWRSMFQKDEEVRIPWSRIKRIGTDIIFVDEAELRTIFDENKEK
ncbi:YlmC/YmxH family sporulation protein [Peribacillus faecalis]|uniref:YlmC/YmxH family sporulation protein n=1 Tax=Peribacillus faecalis TaxID=2772559 RepID=UPI002E2E74CB|nr:YlmC/YmxH family sporulation protein [Peribacillus faecalis]